MNKQSNCVSSKANLIAHTLNVLTALKTSWSMPQMLTTKALALTPKQSVVFFCGFRLATGKKNYNSFFHNDNNSLNYISIIVRQLKQLVVPDYVLYLQGQSSITILIEKYLALCLLPLDWNNVKFCLFLGIILAALNLGNVLLCYCSDAHFWIVKILSCLFCSFSGLFLTLHLIYALKQLQGIWDFHLDEHFCVP